MNIRCFYVKDLVDRGNAEIEYCSTERTLANFFAKPLQGFLLVKFRDVILGHKLVLSLFLDKASNLKECVKPIKETSRNRTSGGESTNVV